MIQKIVAKISVMGAFKKYFEYHMDLCGCGIPYIILEGTADDYKEIISFVIYIFIFNNKLRISYPLLLLE